MKFTEHIEAARLRAVQRLRERKERAAEKKAQRQAQAQTEHGHGRFFLLHVPATATICAAFVEVYWALLFCIEATGRVIGHFDIAAAWNAPWRFVWDFAFSGNAFVLLGLLAATAPIVMISMVWLPVQFAMRGFGRWRRGTLIAVGLLANAIVIISGTVVMNANRQEQVRAAVVTEQAADANRAMLAASVDDLRAELETLMNHRSTYVATAASVGLEAYQRDYASDAAIAAERDPARRGLLTRARGAAARADELRAQIAAARAQVAQAAPAAATAAVVRDDVGAPLNGFAEQVKVWRPPLIAIGCTMIGILGAWWTLAMLLHMNPRDVLRSGWADDSHRIEDLREEARPVAQPMKPPRRKFTEADTGEEIEQTLVPAHYRTIKKGQKTKVVFPAPDLPDETGVEQDGGGRIGSVQESVDVPIEDDDGGSPTASAASPPVDAAVTPPSAEPEVQPEPSTDLTPEDEAALDGLGELDAASESDASTEQPAEQEREPETDPSRLIAAE